MESVGRSKTKNFARYLPWSGDFLRGFYGDFVLESICFGYFLFRMSDFKLEVFAQYFDYVDYKCDSTDQVKLLSINLHVRTVLKVTQRMQKYVSKLKLTIS